jgi:hypothetical protein
MVGDKPDEEEGCLIKMLLEEALARQRNKIMDNFARIFQ